MEEFDWEGDVRLVDTPGVHAAFLGGSKIAFSPGQFSPLLRTRNHYESTPEADGPGAWHCEVTSVAALKLATSPGRALLGAVRCDISGALPISR